MNGRRYCDSHGAQCRPKPIASNACAIRERTGDGRPAGRCWYHIVDGKCPRHGDVRAVQAHYLATAELTDERDRERGGR